MARATSEQIRDFLVKQWMTHDAMWFAHSVEEMGVESADRVNGRAVRSMARVEAKRLMRLLGLPRVIDFDGFRDFVDQAWPVIGAKWMGFSHAFPAAGVMRCQMHDCFAHQGLKRLGVIEQYHCGIFQRVEGWMEELGVGFAVTPRVTGCMMHEQGHCHRVYTLTSYSG